VKSLPFALLALVALGCPSRETTTTTDTVSTSGTMATGTASKTSTGATGGTISSLSAGDKEFFIAVAKANASELALSRIASDQATKANVRDFANRMLTDHARLDQQLKQLALQKGVALPTPVTSESLPSGDIDHAYTQRMVSGHQKAVSDFSSANLQDPDLRAWAAQTLPMLRDHLAAAQALSSS
jgi:putative membrane protein